MPSLPPPAPDAQPDPPSGVCPIHNTPSEARVSVDPTLAPDYPVVTFYWICRQPAYSTHTWREVGP